MEDSVFTKMIKGEINCEAIYEDESCIVILTHEPMTPGHCLVIPKQQIDHLWDVPDELYHHLMDVAKRMALRVRQVYGYERVGTIVEGYGVPHAHIHIFGYEQPLESTITHHIEHKRVLSADELAQEATKLRVAE